MSKIKTKFNPALQREFPFLKIAAGNDSAKFNSDLKCSDYYDSIKNNKNLLAKVHSNEKYRAGTTSSPSSQQSTSSAAQEEAGFVFHSDEEYEEDLFHESQ